MRKWLIVLALLCIFVCAAAAEEVNPFIGSWVLTALGDMPADIGSQRLMLFDDGEGIWTHDGALTAVKWTAEGNAVDVAAGDAHTIYAIGDSGWLVAPDGRTFERPMDASRAAEFAGVWELDRAVLGDRRVKPQDVNLFYRLTLLADGTGLFGGEGIDSAAITWIVSGDDLHVHGDGACMLYRIGGDLIEADFAQLDSTLIFARVQSEQGPAAEAQTLVRTTGNVNIRSGAGKTYEKLGVAPEGTEYPYAGETLADERGMDWYRIISDDGDAWVSSQYAIIIE